MKHRTPKVLILGSGLAGLSTALQFVEHFSGDIQVTILSKVDAAEGSTRYAQGGIASVWSKDDSFESHVKDTLIAGAGLCRESAVEICVKEGPDRVRELIRWGVEFTKNHSKNNLDPTEEFDLHREGGHEQRRILHAADLTGLAIEKALLARVAEHPKIHILEDFCAIDLITDLKVESKSAGGKNPKSKKPERCLGVYALNSRTGRVETLSADVTVLATGGAGKAYLYTSNPDTTTGDGIAMAHRAGAKIANLEFIQFHPTCLYHPNTKTFLITEALRGEGAQLRNLSGEAFMERYDERGSLAPRDIVARSIDMEMKRTGQKHVWLDCTHLGEAAFSEHFPNILEYCLKVGINPSKDYIPVVPAAHYTCGGVLVDDSGKTTLTNLYAVGEVACTGLHGANRLASNSLLEAVVFAHRTVLSALPYLEANLKKEAALPAGLPEWEVGRAVELEEQIDIAATWLEIRSILWNYVGIVRSDFRLERALKRLLIIKDEVQDYYWNYLLTKDLIELRNLITVAELIVRCAQARKESRGLHYTVNYPERDDAHFLRDTVI
jgi:L-aspartate oxidase